MLIHKIWLFQLVMQLIGAWIVLITVAVRTQSYHVTQPTVVLNVWMDMAVDTVALLILMSALDFPTFVV